jgi:hypothetical protein
VILFLLASLAGCGGGDNGGGSVVGGGGSGGGTTSATTVTLNDILTGRATVPALVPARTHITICACSDRRAQLDRGLH